MRGIVLILLTLNGQEGWGKTKKESSVRKKKSGWAHHVSAQPLLYVIHDRRRAADTLKGSQTATGGQQCHKVKIKPTKNITNITFKWTPNAK